MIPETIKTYRHLIYNSVIIVIALFSTLFVYRFFPSLFPQDILFAFVLGFGVYFGVVSLFGVLSIGLLFWAKNKNEIPSKLAIVGITLFSATVVIALISFTILQATPRTLPSGSDIRSFDSNEWKLESSTAWNEGISIREKMLKDVVDNVLPGKTKEQIEHQLGSSLETDYFRSINKDLIYYLGPERDGLINIDSEWLLIWVNENGIFEKYQIFND